MVSEGLDCVDGNIGRRLICILSYNGSGIDIIINYLLFIINLLWCLAACRFHAEQESERAWKIQIFSMLIMMGVIVFQISLCFIVGCMGISIIWCAMAVWMASKRQQFKQRDEANLAIGTYQWTDVELFIVVIDTGAIFYYGFMAQPITTFAHLCALILGAILSMISITMFDLAEDSGVTTALIVNERHENLSSGSS